MCSFVFILLQLALFFQVLSMFKHIPEFHSFLKQNNILCAYITLFIMN
jgi:hypothetical protein